MRSLVEQKNRLEWLDQQREHQIARTFFEKPSVLELYFTPTTWDSRRQGIYKTC